ncbi:MASE1 domain-containing protein [Streptomyces sp. AK02-01A]|uniref:MASE1 domain-containing protein n=1 Tax=Streptomyces sp. AK02-01A TaxID=3028648 RepID=UPI0029B3BCC4|nr:MASE1 domain-containing protein [Streptomyces sp. AK02-01A]MDX3854132.1 MASE1 domain-containing protein [Streptomyces sp. AK02-01A]
MVRTEEKIRHLSVAVLRILAVTVAYYATGQIGLIREVVLEGAVVTPLWPSTGVALSCLLWLGVGVWPGITLGTLLSIATVGPLRLGDLGILAGNTLAPLCSLWLLRRVGFRPDLARLRDGLALVFLGALAGMLISSTLGTWMMVVSGRLRLEGFWPVWAAWWTGDAMGVLVVTPLLLVLRRARLPRDLHRWGEAAALAVSSVAITLVATRSSVSLLFLVFPLIIWAALRFEFAGSAPCVLLVSVLAIVAATDRVGPFAEHSLFEVMFSLQALNGCSALTGLLLAAVVTEQKNIRRKVEEACEELASVVDQLAPEVSVNRWPPEGGKRQAEG